MPRAAEERGCDYYIGASPGNFMQLAASAIGFHQMVYLILLQRGNRVCRDKLTKNSVGEGGV